jgi:hypothetical protein
VTKCALLGILTVVRISWVGMWSLAGEMGSGSIPYLRELEGEGFVLDTGYNKLKSAKISYPFS